METDYLYDPSEIPSLDTWSFQIRLMSDGTSPPLTTANAIRNAVVSYFESGDQPNSDQPKSKANSSGEEQDWQRAAIIRDEIENILATRLSGPDTIYHLIDYKESQGSLIIEFGVLLVALGQVYQVYQGVAQYRDFRDGLDQIVDDLKSLFSGVKGLTVRVSKRFKARQSLIQRRKDLRIDRERVRDQESKSKHGNNS
jgi:hypothetical protein